MPKSGWALRKTKAEIIGEIDRLMGGHTESEVAQLLNQQGWRSSTGSEFTDQIVRQLRHSHKLKTREQRLHEQGWSLPLSKTDPLLLS